MRADVIHVMHNGHVVQSGTHSDLLETGGLYAESWRQQMELVPPESRFASV
jgi:ABC-type multidrug transport system fused ATPase/permease subunit